MDQNRNPLKINSKTNSDYFLWERFKNQDKNALSEIYKSNYAVLFDYGWRIIKDEDLVRESIQELFYYLISNLNSLGTTDNIRFYLMASLRRRIFTKLKGDKQMLVSTNDMSYQFDLEPSIEESMINNEISEERKIELERNIKKLPSREKEAIYLKFYKNMNYDEITKIMGINYDSARKLVYRAIKSLRELLDIKIK